MAEIAYWIAVEDKRPQTARRIVEEIRERAEWYAARPAIGQSNPDFPVGTQYFRHKRWVVVYVARDHGIDVLRVVDSARDFPTLFS